MRIFDSLVSSASVFVPGLVTGLASLGLALGLAGGVSCNPVSVFTCATTEACVAEAGAGAICEANSLCTVPDPDCPSMKRWHERASDLAGTCFDPSQLGGTDSIAATAGTSTGEGGGTTTGEPDTATTQPVEGSGDTGSSGSPPPMTDSGGSTSTGAMPGECDDLFGMAPDYILCMETADACRFNATTGGGSCDDICGMFGSTCNTAFNNSASDCASIMDEVACAEVAQDNICECAKP